MNEALNILVVDDDRDTVDTLYTILNGEGGHRVATATDIENARRLAQTGVYHVILCDIRMPYTNNAAKDIDTLRKALGLRSKLAVMTGDRNQEADVYTYADRFFPKPFNIDELLPEIAKLGEMAIGEGFSSSNEPDIVGGDATLE